jgi:hypothetical protein
MDAMNTMVLLTLVSVVGAAALFVALAVYLFLIIAELEQIGGERGAVYGTPASLLSKIRLGVRAIEVQTGGLAPQVTKLNAGLSAIRDGLRAIDANLAGVIAAVSRQEGR